MYPLAGETQLMDFTILSLVKIVARAGFGISPSDRVALGPWRIGHLAWLGHSPLFALKHTLEYASFRAAERQIVSIIFRVVEQRKLAIQLIGGVGDMILVLESLTDLLSVNQCIAFALIGEVTRDTTALVPVKEEGRPPWPLASDVENSIAPAFHRQAKRLATRR